MKKSTPSIIVIVFLLLFMCFTVDHIPLYVDLVYIPVMLYTIATLCRRVDAKYPGNQ